MKTKVLLTGGAGFAGAHILEHIIKTTDWEVFVLDRISYAGSLERIADYAHHPRVKFVYHDFRAAFPASVLKALDGTQYVIHNGGETHVERSLQDPLPFVESNVLGTMHVLDACKELSVQHVIYISTDEVLGPAPDGVDHTEHDLPKPSNPYSASKAGGEAMAYAYFKSYRLPVTITRTMNLFGERQHPEKFIPMTIRKILNNELVTVHGTHGGRIGSRKWLHARNQADAIKFLLQICEVIDIRGEIYHIAGLERTNLEIVALIAKYMGKAPKYEIVDFHSQRPGHDLRYSLSDAKLRSLGWEPKMSFIDSLHKTIDWTIKPENRRWLEDEYSIKEQARAVTAAY